MQNGAPEFILTPSATTFWFLNCAFENCKNIVNINFKYPILELDDIFDDLLEDFDNMNQSDSSSFKA